MELKPCPFCKQSVRIVVCDDEGNIHGEIGCEYERNPWGGLQYGIVHDGWGECFASSDDDVLGGILFHDVNLLVEQWNTADRKANDDLISRAAAIDYLMTNMGWRDEDGYEVDDADEKRAIITDLINGIPAVDAVPVVHGHWTRIHIKGKEYGKVYYQHENCAPLLF